MERGAFFLLYANLNSIAELALQRLASEVLTAPPIAPPAELALDESLSPAELEARILARFQNLDLSAMDDVYEKVSSRPIDMEQAAADAAFKPPDEERRPLTERAAAADEPFDLATYLDRGYASEAQLEARIATLHARADLPALEKQLAEYPSHLPSLTRRLSADEMEFWLTLYAAGDETLHALVGEMRNLELASA